MNNDPTSWWGPNPYCVAMMLSAVGYAQITNTVQLWLGNRSIFSAIKADDSDVQAMEARDHQARHRYPFKRSR